MLKNGRLFRVVLCLAVALSFAASSYADDTGVPGRARLGIMRFDSKTYDVPDKLAASISDIFGRFLYKSKGLMRVERERLDDVANELKLGMYALLDDETAAKIGKLAGCEYILMGSITELARAASGAAVPIFGLPISVGTAKQKVKATLDVRVVKVETGEVVFAEAAEALAEKSDTGLTAYGFGVENSGFGGIEGTAITKAAMDLAPKIEKELTGRDTLTKIFEAENSQKGKKSRGKTSDKSSSSTRTRKKKADKEPEISETTSEPEESAQTIGASSSETSPESQNADDFEKMIHSRSRRKKK